MQTLVIIRFYCRFEKIFGEICLQWVTCYFREHILVSQLKGTPKTKLYKWDNLKRHMCIQIQDEGTKHPVASVKVLRVKWEWQTLGKN